jgi:hypothetical protein
MKTRKERRAEARRNKTKFEPQYNSGIRFDGEGKQVTVGGSPKTHEEMYGVGYERFNSKHVTVRKEDEK